MTALSRLIVIAGPTGAGKSDLAVDVAEKLDGEIVNADALQLYRGMDIGTAKLPVAQRRGIPHHQLDVLDITEYATVAAYQRAARADVEDILRRGKTPILVGGSGLYLQSVVDDLEFPATDAHVRAGLEAELVEVGELALHARLAALDPVAATAIEPRNGRKVVRALEVISLTGRPFSATMPTRGELRYRGIWFCVDRDTAELDQRIERRVRAMVEQGLLEEVRGLEKVGLRQGITASRALGYQQMLDVLDGVLNLEQAMLDTMAGTRRYVRRQRSWFRRDTRQIWLRADSTGLLAQVITAVKAP
ncbi:tRNA (adenosine(37)-N6)-dimethylallyltransferase MiaA [Nakamurella antarctica]|uniref:tRNA dimethylallyltransferase n=1 Tax=Nakamurella antarctica TaxID=1902245 RepID=A0A3G8ZLJ4_9ACTN|nr:tRNA (adenosine(37)-N6)-dimethylallyltransferase MiaA [Nakamurella antarctica]AZI57647.1 tRNA (adenosine(37)-N6)-dimethylallyltransferase MiaA [Nakamurella antarctica]